MDTYGNFCFEERKLFKTWDILGVWITDEIGTAVWPNLLYSRQTYFFYRARLMTGGGYRLLASGKLWRARSRLYQRRFLRPNTHFSAFFEIYKICNPLHRSKLNKIRKVRQYFGDFYERRVNVPENLQIFERFWVRSGGKDWNSGRSRKMLKNAYLDAKIGVDTAENERSEKCEFGSW